ncbi:PAS domain-containing hybrid sensor histidine kinase/response regulator [Ancylomarina longa]|nr:PAS domain-containing hybrid sensor histidine kinase/response regulator [Ancylomarina longa]
MAEQDKTKGELTKEIKRLQQEIGSLKASFDNSVVRDKQELKKQILSKSELQVLIDNKKESIWSIDNNYNILACNNYFKNAFFAAYQQELKVGMNILETLSPELLAFWKPKYDAALLGKNISFEFSETILGEHYYFNVDLNSILENGEIKGVAAFSVDVTTLKKTEESIIKSKKLHRNFLENNEAVILAFETETSRITFANNSAVEFYGWEKEQLLQMNINQINTLPPKEIKSKIIEARKKNHNFCTFKHRLANGSIRDVEVYQTKLNLNNKEIFSLIVHDISEQKKVEEALRWAKFKFRTFADYTADWEYWENEDNKIMYMSPSCEKFTGYTADEFISNPELANSIIHPDDLNAVLKHHDKTYSYHDRDKLENIEFRIVKKDGFIVNTYHTCRPIYDENKDFLGRRVSNRDITERLQSRKALQESEKRFQILFNKAPLGYQSLDYKGNFIEINQQWLDMLGYSREEVIGNWFGKFMTVSSQEKVKNTFPLFLKQGYINTKFEMVHKNGSLLTINFVGKIGNDSNDNFLQTHCILQDITASKIAEDALKESERKFRRLFDDHAAVKLLIDPETGNIADANKSAIAFYGWSYEELKSMNIDQINTLEPEELRREMGDARNNSRNFFEFRHYLKNGKIKDVAVFSSKIEIEGKEYLHSIIQDITQSKLAEKQLKLLGQAIDQNPVIILIANKVGEIEYVNPIFTKVTGYTREEVMGKNPRFLQSGEHKHEFYKELWDTITSGKNWHGEFHNKNKNGEYYWENAIISPVFDDHNKILHFLAVKEDITEKKKMISDLIAAKDKAEESDRLKSAFLANMSHEIRTPMNAILGFSELLKEPDLANEQQQDYIALIEKGGARMLNIINQIMDISKIESNLMEVSIKEININKQIEHTYNFLRSQVEAKGLEISYKTPLQDKDAIIKTDPDKVLAVLLNLVNNAFKYTDKGTIEFGYEKKDKYLEFFVKDTGIGVPQNRQKAIFERFIQADIEDKMARQGAGLGLSISKAYVEMLGGKIWLVSEKDRGSVFYFTLPYNTDKAKNVILKNVISASGENYAKNLKILIAEDDETSEKLAEIMIDKFGKEILIARTGQEAVEICKNNPDIDLVLMDILMPEMNGLEATEKIRQFNKEIIIIAQTAYAMKGDREKAINAGCNDYISKPIKKSILLELMKKYFKKD